MAIVALGKLGNQPTNTVLSANEVVFQDPTISTQQRIRDAEAIPSLSAICRPGINPLKLDRCQRLKTVGDISIEVREDGDGATEKKT